MDTNPMTSPKVIVSVQVSVTYNENELHEYTKTYEHATCDYSDSIADVARDGFLDPSDPHQIYEHLTDELPQFPV